MQIEQLELFLEWLGSISVYLFAVAFLGFTFYKKRSEIGKTWDGAIGANVSIKDINLTCSHCSHNRFTKREGLLNTTWVTFFRLAFCNQGARCFVCKKCGYVHWFIATEEKAEITRDLDHE